MQSFERGRVEGQDWICGNIPVGKKGEVFLDTRTGEGVDSIVRLMRNFVSYQSSKTSFPAMMVEDVQQEIYLLILEAIPKYDISRKANMLTFLQNHVKNRLINKYKFFSEKKRIASSVHTREKKVRCPSCRSLTRIEGGAKVVCGRCNFEESSSLNEKKWKRYNVPVVPIAFSHVERGLPSEVMSLDDIISTKQSFSSLLGQEVLDADGRAQINIDFKNFYSKQNDTNKIIISKIIEGHSYKEISVMLNIPKKAAQARVAKAIKKYNSCEKR